MTQRSDNALRNRILAGNHEACVELVRQHHAPIYRLLVHLCRDAHLAEDLTQESFLAAWAKIGSFKATSSLKTWLHRIAYRKFIDSHRRNERTVATHAEAAIDQVQSNTPNPYDSALVSEENRRLYQALDCLKPEERDVVVLHYLQGLSYEEMADVLGQPTGTVKWRTSLALENLRSALESKENRKMNQGVPPSPEPDPRRLNLESLEQQLRALPPFVLPDTLPLKLIAAIPPLKAGGWFTTGVKKRWPWIAGGGAICITLSVVFYSWLMHSNRAPAPNENRNATGASTTPPTAPASSQAIRDYEKAVSVDPYNADAWFKLAKAQAEMHRSADAISSAQKALDVARSRNMGGLINSIEAWLRWYRMTQAEKPSP